MPALETFNSSNLLHRCRRSGGLAHALVREEQNAVVGDRREDQNPHCFSSTEKRAAPAALVFIIRWQSSRGAAGDDTKAVVLDLMQPLAAGRQFRRFCR